MNYFPGLASNCAQLIKHFLNNSWSKEIKQEIRKHLEMNENERTADQNF
jgi:hypothetical protein